MKKLNKDRSRTEKLCHDKARKVSSFLASSAQASNNRDKRGARVMEDRYHGRYGDRYEDRYYGRWEKESEIIRSDRVLQAQIVAIIISVLVILFLFL